MKRASSVWLTLAAIVVLAPVAWAGERVHHDMEIALDPATGLLEVRDRLTLPDQLPGESFEFLLNGAFEVETSEPPVEKVPLGDVETFFGINASSDVAETIELARYRVAAAEPGGVVEITYGGRADFGLADQKEEYTRGFRETAGLLGEEGVYLAGSGFWYPWVDKSLVEFEMVVSQPENWHVISQGDGTSRDEAGRAHWSSAGAMDEIYLVGGPMIVYRESAGAVEALVYLRAPDDALAGKYLEATAQYVEMYRNLIGPYPYGKFALIENFWETGYGMPSFTLLGPRVIRFPFILHSSYPHEILHNWWGNSVFVDYESGNWCEGLTAYLADHLIKEQRGQGEAYRRETLQKYRNYVKEGLDFPLTEFRSRHSAATEAVGYGKMLMLAHMLRNHLGEDNFRNGLAKLYRGHRGTRASFADLQTVFESASGEDLGWFFEQWVERTGAPDLAIELDGVEEIMGQRVATGRIVQTQEGEPYRLDIPLAVQTTTGTKVVTVAASGREAPFSVDIEGDPLALRVDPQFDLFRLLDPREIPSSVGQIFGAPEILAVMPSGDAESDAYRELMEGWVSDSHAIEFVGDDEIEALPEDRSVWLVGAANRFAEGLFTGGANSGVALDGAAINFDGESVTVADHSWVAVARHPDALDLAVGWLAVGPEAAFPGMGRKLPHYGKYSYLAFEGDEPTNVVKGQWSTAGSPLELDLRPDSERTAALPPLDLEPRVALAELPPVFSEKTLMAHVEYLASPELEGRAPGSIGGNKAALYVAAQFEEIGLRAGGGEGSWFQEFEIAEGPDGKPIQTANVVGYLPGTETGWADQSVIVSAHYDHLGHGWPDVHQGDEGEIHLGADDNASGVAVLLELARSISGGAPPKRNLVFVAFGGEEAGRLGSKYFVRNAAPFPVEGIRGVINIDTVGRLFDGQVSVLGAGTSTEWPHIFRGSGFVTGVPNRSVSGSAEASDQMSFIEQGIPGVQIFTGAHEDYHRPGDVAEDIDGAGLVKVATFVKEGVVYMGDREEPLTLTIESAVTEAKPAAPAGTSSGRRARLGTVPDFGFPGPGVRVESVPEGSPAAVVGVQAGDVLISLDGREVADLRGYSDILKTLEPGQTVPAVFQRGEEEIAVEVTLGAR